MKQEPAFVTSLTIGGETHEIKVYGNVDKTTNFIYYTFEFNDDNGIVLSKYDGTEWKVDNAGGANRFIANLLGKLIDNNTR
ncbi:hypothetical protein OGH69_04045 [Flavobacterium sp. MFBS3-15]|uniref:hypothetical protein n=1 Tax=Flavobacterium sp. MFBS3-15 TaxID=2989816 RepID=UPI0022366B9A|nr:hypothetical protein [Flavobacterium sp. MFBS3-15]MCW4468127.1 hypothetical protein [Flavobacterium sp. MFBS3-15]